MRPVGGARSRPATSTDALQLRDPGGLCLAFSDRPGLWVPERPPKGSSSTGCYPPPRKCLWALKTGSPVELVNAAAHNSAGEMELSRNRLRGIRPRADHRFLCSVHRLGRSPARTNLSRTWGRHLPRPGGGDRELLPTVRAAVVESPQSVNGIQSTVLLTFCARTPVSP